MELRFARGCQSGADGILSALEELQGQDEIMNAKTSVRTIAKLYQLCRCQIGTTFKVR